VRCFDTLSGEVGPEALRTAQPRALDGTPHRAPTPNRNPPAGGSLKATSSAAATSFWCAARYAPESPASAAAICARGGLMVRSSHATAR
jgi:hypothetical protein